MPIKKKKPQIRRKKKTFSAVKDPGPVGAPPPGATPERPSVDTNALNAFLDSIRSFNVELIFGLTPGQSLYHYTDLPALIAIVTDSDLRLTHSLYLNDAEEMIHGYRAAQEVIEIARKARPDQKWLSYLDQLSDLLKQPVPQGVYICCFCQKDNLLSQWRSYGANGTGVSVRFDPQIFSFVTGPDSPHGGMMRLWKVFYEPDQQKRILRKAIDFAFEHPPPGKSAAQDIARQAADAIEFFIPTFKNQDFSEESEWRLIFTPPQNCPVKPKFRVGRGMLIPYFSLKELSGGQITPQLTLPIRGVCIGPSPNQSLNADSSRMILNLCGYPGAEITRSNTPYRG